MKPTIDAYTDFQKYYDLFNKKLFGGKLPDCLITYQRGKNFMAYYSPKRFSKGEQKTDEIAMNPTAFSSHDKTQILQTLVHEMCHLQQEHFGKPSRGGYHNKEWGSMMKNVGLQPFGVGKNNYGKETGQQMSDKIIEGGAFDKLIKNDNYDFKMWVESSTDKDIQLNILTIKENVVEQVQESNLFIDDMPIEAQTYLNNKKIELEEVLNEVKEEANILAKEQGYKIKYQCSCNNTVWGKAGLKLMCMDCNNFYLYSL